MNRPPLPAAYDPWARLALARWRVETFEYSRTRISQKAGHDSPVYALAHRAVEAANRELDRAIEGCCE